MFPIGLVEVQHIENNVLYMYIRLKLLKFFYFCAAHLPARLDIETKFPYFLFLTWLSIIRNQKFRLYI